MTELTQELINKLSHRIRKGAFPRQACAAVGVEFVQFQKWLAEAEREGPRCGLPWTLRQNVKVAKADAEIHALEKIQEAGEKDWRALAWYLERTKGRRYAQKLEIKKDAKEEASGQVLELLKSKLDPDTYERVLDAILEASGDSEEDEAGLDG